MIEWLQDDVIPSRDLLREHPVATRKVWALVPEVHLERGVLVRQSSEDGSTKLVVPCSLRRKLFDLTHAGPLAAHLGPQRTYQQLLEKYWWPRMKEDIRRWCRQCPACARAKGPPTRHRGKLQKVITGAPLDIVAVDILSGLPVTPEGERYLLVLVDYFTKWATAFALPDAEASTCMRAMYNGFFATMGFPRQIHSDCGKNFEGKLFQELCKLVGVEKSHTTTFHPQSDGQTERMNRSLLQMLRTTADENPFSWPQRLHTVLAAYRMTVHSVTGVTPNLAMLGREVLLPATLIASPPDEADKVNVPFVRDLRDRMREAHEKVRQNTKRFARTEKRYYDSKARPQNLKEGQRVWLYWPKPLEMSKFKKLNRFWSGPWTIVKFKSPLVVEIRHTTDKGKNGKLKVQTVHVDRLTPCQTPPDAETDGGMVVPDGQTVEDTQTVEDNQTDTQDMESTDTQETMTDSVSSRPVRAKKLPKSLEGYIL